MRKLSIERFNGRENAECAGAIDELCRVVAADVRRRTTNRRTASQAPPPYVGGYFVTCRAQRARQGGFTFIELLVVISVIALLLTVLAPALAFNRTDSAAAKCMSNQRQIATAWLMYASENPELLT